MSPFFVDKSAESPGGVPLHRAARRLRLDIEAQMVARGLADESDALQIVGLLLQVEGIALGQRSTPIEVPAVRRLGR